MQTTVEAETAQGATNTVRGAGARLPARRVLPERASVRPTVYGICVVCHEKTPMALLAAIPATSLCLPCARKERRWATA